MRREFLKSLKVGDQELPKELIDAIMEEHGRDIEAAKGKYSDYELLKAQLAEANETIEGFKAMDVEAIRREAEGWREKFEQAQKEHTAKLADLEFRRTLESAVAAAKGRSAKAIMALLDVDDLKASKNQAHDIQAALEAVKKENAYLFEEPPEYVPPAGGAPSAVGSLRDAIAEKLSIVKEK